MKMKNRYLFGIIYGLSLTVITFFLLIKTFVIKEKYAVVEDSNTSADEEIIIDSETSTITDTSYSSSNISISLETIRKYNTTIYIADVQISDISLLKTAFAENSYGRNITEKTSEIAENNNAILAINGDYYGFRTSGYVIRNGKLYRAANGENEEDLVIYENGDFEIINEDNISASKLLENGAIQVFSFGPALINNGEISVTKNQEITGKSMVSNPRTAIGIIDNLHYLFVVSDGRTDESDGLSLYELASVMKDYNCKIAYNLDGGGSSTMVFNGEVINNPTSGRSIKERSVSDIVYIGY